MFECNALRIDQCGNSHIEQTRYTRACIRRSWRSTNLTQCTLDERQSLEYPQLLYPFNASRFCGIPVRTRFSHEEQVWFISRAPNNCTSRRFRAELTTTVEGAPTSRPSLYARVIPQTLYVLGSIVTFLFGLRMLCSRWSER